MSSRFASLLRWSAVSGLLATVVALPALAAAPTPQAPDQAPTREKIIRYVRQRFNVPDTVKITMTDFRETIYPDFYETTLTLDDGKDKRSQPFFVSKNGRYLTDGNLYNLGGDPRKDMIRLMSLEDQPTQGPATAPVTLVEYSDLQCPTCARLHEMLETDIIPKYGDKLRVVFKEFPLVAFHDWALTAAVAAQCTYQIDPSKYVAFRSLVFKNQATLSADHIRDLLLHLGAEAGVDNLKLAACIDSQAALPRVEENLREGQSLGVASTPTSLINGRIIVGAPSDADFYKLIDEAMRDPK